MQSDLLKGQEIRHPASSKTKIVDEKAQDKSTQALRDFNQKCLEDPRVEKVLLPLRDGLLMMRVI